MNRVINGDSTATTTSSSNVAAANSNNSNNSKDPTGALRGELWCMSKQRLQRFDGSFREYKKMIAKKVLQGKDI